MKVIVTGGAGFIGSNLIEFLIDKNYHVTVLDNFSVGRLSNLARVSKRISLVECDISIPGDWVKEFHEANYVIHLAALADIVPSIQDPESYFKSNVTGTLNVLQAARGKKLKKFIYSASSSCYGIPKYYPTNENAEISPQYPYALTKKMGEELVRHWSEVYGVPAISLRFFNVYGPKARTSGTYGAVLGVFLAQRYSKKPLTIVGDGNQTRDFTYVSDVVSAIYRSMYSKKSGYRFYNVGSGATVSINRIAEIIGGPTVNIPKRPGEPESTFADITKIKDEIGWQPQVSIEDGMKILMKDLSVWENAPLWDPSSIANATKDWFKFLG